MFYFFTLSKSTQLMGGWRKTGESLSRDSTQPQLRMEQEKVGGEKEHGGGGGDGRIEEEEMARRGEDDSPSLLIAVLPRCGVGNARHAWMLGRGIGPSIPAHMMQAGAANGVLFSETLLAGCRAGGGRAAMKRILLVRTLSRRRRQEWEWCRDYPLWG